MDFLIKMGMVQSRNPFTYSDIDSYCKRTGIELGIEEISTVFKCSQNFYSYCYKFVNDKDGKESSKVRNTSTAESAMMAKAVVR